MSEDNVTDTAQDPKASAPDPKASVPAPDPKASVPAPAPAPAPALGVRHQRSRQCKPLLGSQSWSAMQSSKGTDGAGEAPPRSLVSKVKKKAASPATASGVGLDVTREIVDIAKDGKTNSCRYRVGEQWLLFGELGTDAAGLRKRFRAKCPNHAELAKRPISDVEISTATKSTAKSTSKSASAGKRASTTTATAPPAKKAAKSRLSPRLSRCVVWVPLCMFFWC
jgi:hypothetical protein